MRRTGRLKRLLRTADAKPVAIYRRARAGRYAQSKYKRGLKAYRHRLLGPLLLVTAPFVIFYFVVALSHGLEWWSFFAGVACAAAVSLGIYTWDEPPQYVQKWKRGAEGERKTEKVLRGLERIGWKVEHDIQRDGRANLDHVVTGPAGAFLLETKNLAGTITFEDAYLVARQFDDPDEVYRYKTLTPRLRGQAAELSARLRDETGRGRWVTAVVVVWGHFPSEPVTHDSVTYVHGDRLKDWLLGRPTSRNGAQTKVATSQRAPIA